MDPRHRSTTRTSILLAAALALAILLPGAPASAHNFTFHGNANKVCRIDWRDGPEKVERLIRCAARTWPVPGGEDYAVSVARCESGLNPRSVWYGHYGVFQHMLEYWPERAAAYGFRGTSPLNGRANIIVSIRMAHVGGWGPWSCAR